MRYVHQDAGVADVNMSLTAVDVGGGVIVDHFYGNIDVAVNADFGDASVRNLDGNFIGGTNLITYGQSENIGDTGVSSLILIFQQVLIIKTIYIIKHFKVVLKFSIVQKYTFYTKVLEHRVMISIMAKFMLMLMEILVI